MVKFMVRELYLNEKALLSAIKFLKREHSYMHIIQVQNHGIKSEHPLSPSPLQTYFRKVTEVYPPRSLYLYIFIYRLPVHFYLNRIIVLNCYSQLVGCFNFYFSEVLFPSQCESSML